MVVTVQEEGSVRWGHILFPPVVEAPHGLFRPLHPLVDFGLPALGTLLILGLFFKSVLSAKPNYVLLSYLVLIAAMVCWRWRARRKFGRLGEPIVRVDRAEIYLRLPQSLHPSHLQVPLADLRTLVVKGAPGQRSYVFERHVGKPLAVRPGFGRLDSRVVGFLQRTLPASIPVEVHEPPTFFGAIRGE